MDHVVAAFGVYQVVAVAAEQRVGKADGRRRIDTAVVAEDGVVAAEAPNRVGAHVGRRKAGIVVADQDVAGLAAGDDIVAIAAIDRNGPEVIAG